MILLLTIIGLIGLYLLGPSARRPQIDPALPIVESDLVELEARLFEEEHRIRGLKPDNEARIVWADPTAKVKTPYSVVYLHGLGGSQGDGAGVHAEFAKRYGCNLYLARLHGHGIEEPKALQDLTPEKYLASATHAVSVGRQLGDKVIIMATSTGATLALIIASAHPEIASLILYSPNVDFRSQATSLLLGHWGLEIGRLVLGGRDVVSDDPDSVSRYWCSKYRLEALRAAQALIAHTMTPETFARIHQPLFMGYYYRDDAHMDDRVSVPRMLEMFDQIQTPAAEKRKVAFPNAGVHPIASALVSRDVDAVREETFNFAEEVLNLVPTH